MGKNRGEDVSKMSSPFHVTHFLLRCISELPHLETAYADLIEPQL